MRVLHSMGGHKIQYRIRNEVIGEKIGVLPSRENASLVLRSFCMLRRLVEGLVRRVDKECIWFIIFWS